VSSSTGCYAARRKRDRLDEAGTTRLLGRLGATPWDEASYALDEACFVAMRTNVPASVTRRSRASVLGR
jgi:hypothetical protein